MPERARRKCGALFVFDNADERALATFVAANESGWPNRRGEG
jgi:hypothetical protein